MDNGVHGAHGEVAARPVEMETRPGGESATAQLQALVEQTAPDLQLRTNPATLKLVKVQIMSCLFYRHNSSVHHGVEFKTASGLL